MEAHRQFMEPEVPASPSLLHGWAWNTPYQGIWTLFWVCAKCFEGFFLVNVLYLGEKLIILKLNRLITRWPQVMAWHHTLQRSAIFAQWSTAPNKPAVLHSWCSLESQDGVCLPAWDSPSMTLRNQELKRHDPVFFFLFFSAYVYQLSQPPQCAFPHASGIPASQQSSGAQYALNEDTSLICLSLDYVGGKEKTQPLCKHNTLPWKATLFLVSRTPLISLVSLVGSASLPSRDVEKFHIK